MSQAKTDSRAAHDKNNDLADIKFEDGLKKLEETLESLENNELSLEDSIKNYETGLKYYNFCKEKLDSLEKKIEILMKNSTSGEITPVAYTRPEIEDAGGERRELIK